MFPWAMIRLDRAQRFRCAHLIAEQLLLIQPIEKVALHNKISRSHFASGKFGASATSAANYKFDSFVPMREGRYPPNIVSGVIIYRKNLFVRCVELDNRQLFLQLVADPLKKRIQIARPSMP